ncbi:hypothetical protein PsorP6_015166 [Peronosclerospora sorghi]|uniref:Uncharacterized protein n=1 Tax=Peronosclerospora sorghi TaxID=230839 RepID=A0ACC0VSV9_9STRA|nr:hypothetical protein PsorP6_015166 [Peronosclerospora sorghi]
MSAEASKRAKKKEKEQTHPRRQDEGYLALKVQVPANERVLQTSTALVSLYMNLASSSFKKG